MKEGLISSHTTIEKMRIRRNREEWEGRCKKQEGESHPKTLEELKRKEKCGACKSEGVFSIEKEEGGGGVVILNRVRETKGAVWENFLRR